MVTRKRKLEPEEDMAANDPHTTPAPQPKTLADDTISEYEMPDGLTYLLTARDAELRGAKAVSKPANKAVTPQNK